jgi:hypothetical protein
LFIGDGDGSGGDGGGGGGDGDGDGDTVLVQFTSMARPWGSWAVRSTLAWRHRRRAAPLEKGEGRELREGGGATGGGGRERAEGFPDGEVVADAAIGAVDDVGADGLALDVVGL